MPRRKSREIKYLSFQQISDLLKTIKNPRDQAIWRVAYHRGLRAGEIGRLRLDDLDRTRWRLRVHRLKGSYGGQYPLVESEIKALRAWLRVRGYEPGPLFPSKKKRGISQQMLDVLMKRYCADAQIRPDLAHFHSLKHSCATHLAEKGVDLLLIRDHLGHANIQNTMKYLAVANRRRDELAATTLRDW